MTAPIILYGYTIAIPEEDSIAFIRDMTDMNDVLEEPIHIYSITYDTTDAGDIELIVGFIPDAILSKNMEYFTILREFVTDNPMFDGIEISSVPNFYTGFEWKKDDDSSNDSESSSDHDSLCSDEDESTSDASSDKTDESDDEDVHDEENDKSISHYISKYYI